MPAKKTQKKHHSLLDHIIQGHLYTLIAILPLLFWLDTATIFAVPKLLGLHLISISALFVIFLKVFLERGLQIRTSPLIIFLGLWTVSLLLSTVFSINQITSLYGQYGRFMGLFTFLNLMIIPVYLANYFDRQQFRSLILVSIITATLVATYGILQYFDFFGLWPAEFRWTDAPQNRVFATMGHANHLGAYLAMNFMFLTYIWNKKDFSSNWVAGLAITIPSLLMAACLLLTASRGAVLAFFLVYMILLIIRIIKHYHQMKKKLWFLTATIILIFATAIGSIWVFVDNLDSLGLVARTEQNIASMEKGIIPERLSFLYSSWQMFVDHPLLGTGLSTFRDAYSAYRRTDYIIDGPGNAQYITVPESAHNEYANILATQGLLGLLTFLALLIYLIITLLRRYFSESSESGERWPLVLLGGILVFAVQVLFNFGEIVNWFIFFLLIGIIAADTAKPWKWSIKLPFPLLIILTPLMLLLVGWMMFWTVFYPAQADYYLGQALVTASQKDYPTADRYFQVAIAGQPLEYQLYQDYADFSLQYAVSQSDDVERQNLLQQAVKNYRQAILLNPNYPSTYHNLALTYLQLFRISGNKHYGDLSRENYQKSVEKSPNNPRYLYEYARKLHSDWDDREGAVRLLLQAIQMAPQYQEPQDYLNFLYENHPQLKELSN